MALGELLISPSIARAATIDPVILEGIYSALEVVRLKSIAKQLNSSDIMGLRVSSAYFFKAAENALIFSPIQSMIREKQGFGFSTTELRESLFSAEREIQRRGLLLAPGQLVELLPKRGIAKAEALTMTSRSPIVLGAEYDRVLKDLELMLQGKQNASRRNAQSVGATPQWCYDAGIAVAGLAAISALAGLACYMSEGLYIEACTTAVVFGAAAAVSAMAMAAVCVQH